MTRSETVLLQAFPKDKLEVRSGPTILYPDDESDVLKAVELAAESHLRICPAGAMTNLSLAACDIDCFVISSSNMNRLIEYSPGDLYLTVQSGVLLGAVNSFGADDRLAFALADSGYTGSVGGAVAAGLSARLADETIDIKRWVISLSFITPYGKHVRVGAITVKSVAGYDITKLLVGSRGRFGFITSVTLRLVHESSLDRFDGIVLDELALFCPRWSAASPSVSPAERNLKANIDPNSIFPSL